MGQTFTKAGYGDKDGWDGTRDIPVGESATRKNDFRFLKVLGEGSFGSVHQVRRKKDQVIFACKEVPLSKLTKPQQQTQAFMEIEVMKKLSCPYIVQYIDAFIEKESLHLVLQFCAGGDLTAYLQVNQRLQESTIWRIALRIALGVNYLHCAHILHRDLKSENIFFEGRPWPWSALATADNVLIGDLGLATQLDETAGVAATFCGTPRYLAPEAFSSECFGSIKSDVWAFGLIMYELCSEDHTGPWDEATSLTGLMRRVMREDYPPLPERVRACGIAEVVATLLLKDPLQRPSIKEFLAVPAVMEAGSKHLPSEMGAIDVFGSYGAKDGDEVDYKGFAGCTIHAVLADGAIDVLVPRPGGPAIMRAPEGEWKLKGQVPQVGTFQSAQSEDGVRRLMKKVTTLEVLAEADEEEPRPLGVSGISLPESAVDTRDEVVFFGIEVAPDPPKEGACWTTMRRYREFLELCEALGPEAHFEEAPFPSKTLIKKVDMDGRRLALEAWLKQVLDHPECQLSWSEPLRRFLEIRTKGLGATQWKVKYEPEPEVQTIAERVGTMGTKTRSSLKNTFKGMMRVSSEPEFHPEDSVSSWAESNAEAIAKPVVSWPQSNAENHSFRDSLKPPDPMTRTVSPRGRIFSFED